MIEKKRTESMEAAYADTYSAAVEFNFSAPQDMTDLTKNINENKAKIRSLYQQGAEAAKEVGKSMVSFDDFNSENADSFSFIGAAAIEELRAAEQNIEQSESALADLKEQYAENTGIIESYDKAVEDMYSHHYSLAQRHFADIGGLEYNALISSQKTMEENKESAKKAVENAYQNYKSALELGDKQAGITFGNTVIELSRQAEPAGIDIGEYLSDGIVGELEGIDGWDAESLLDFADTLGYNMGDILGGALGSQAQSIMTQYIYETNDLIPKNVNSAWDAYLRSIGEYANGGFVSAGRAIVAEAGPELLTVTGKGVKVTPLKGSAKNTLVSDYVRQDAGLGKSGIPLMAKGGILIDEWGKWRYLTMHNVLKIDGQLFRISLQNPVIDTSSGTITVTAMHVFYDMNDPLLTREKFPGGQAQAYLDFCMTHTIPYRGVYEENNVYKFTGNTDITKSYDGFDIVNTTLSGALIGADNCFLNCYGGELYRNNFYFSINEKMENSRQNAFYIRYTAEMTRVSQYTDYTDFCTELHAYDNYGHWWGVCWGLSDKNKFLHHPIVRMIQFNYSEPVNIDRLMTDGRNYWNTVDTPKTTYEIQIASLRDDPKYRDFVNLQDYKVGDSGIIYCEELGIETEQKITSVERDELTGDVLRMTLGNLRNRFSVPGYSAGNITSGNSVSDIQNSAMKAQLEELEFNTTVTTPVATSDGEFLTTLDGEYILYKKS